MRTFIRVRQESGSKRDGVLGPAGQDGRAHPFVAKAGSCERAERFDGTRVFIPTTECECKLKANAGICIAFQAAHQLVNSTCVWSLIEMLGKSNSSAADFCMAVAKGGFDVADRQLSEAVQRGDRLHADDRISARVKNLLQRG